jgi:hypothetical protein
MASHSGTSMTLMLPGDGGTLRRHAMRAPAAFAKPERPFARRRALAAAHVVVDALAEYTPGQTPPVDWEATLAFRRHLWSYGIGVAEAMDTSERGPGGLVWSQAQQLIASSLQAAPQWDGAIVCGAGTEQLTTDLPSVSAVADAYIEQVEFIEGHGGSAVIRASHALTTAARCAEDYLDVYSQVLSAARRPAIVHWLGEVFDPSLRGYWGHTDLDQTMDVVLEMAQRNATKLDGIKFSLLDAELESRFRKLLPAGVRCYTGDDYDYPSLILGDGQSHSDGLLGVLDPIGPIASAALQALDAGDGDRYTTLMESTVALALRMFEAPASRYKIGTVFIAYLSGHQNHFRMVSGREGMRSLRHLANLFALADEIGLFPDPELACRRMKYVLALSGIDS